MKKMILLAGFLSMMVFSYAQSQFRLNGFAAYTFQDNFDGYYDANNFFSGKVNGSFQWGVSAEYLPAEYIGVELLYQRSDTKAPTTFKNGAVNPIQTENFNVDLNYIMLGCNGYMNTNNKKIEPYGGFMAGVVIAGIEAPSQNASKSTSNFAWGAKLGTNFWLSDKLALKLQAQMLSSSRITGGQVYFSWWGPVYLDTYSTLWQFSLGGGLALRLGN